MKISDLKPNSGSTKNRKRVGRGYGSGSGHTSGRGNNGRGQRAGCNAKRGFEGGQRPLYKRIPKKKYFHVVRPSTAASINVSDVAHFPEGTDITLEFLIEKHLVKKHSKGLRILGNGDISVVLNFKANYFTPSAKEKIEKSGGKIEVLD